MDAKSRIKDAPESSIPVRKLATTDAASGLEHNPKPRRRPITPEETFVSLLSEIRYTEEKLVYWKMRAAASFAWARLNLPREEWRKLFKDKRLGVGIRAAQMLCRIGDNAGLRRAWNHISLPDSIAALYELAALKPDSISSLCEDDLITPHMTAREAKALVRKALVDEAAGRIRPPLRITEAHTP